ncbi:MAG: DUF1552 domain-containing protein [Armatimonadota bacterium]
MRDRHAVHVSRRAVLRGMGVTMLLPLLESLPAGAAPAAKAAGKAAAARPVRLAVLYMPNGVNPKEWTPKGYGSEFELSSILQPLEKVKSDLLVFSELMNKNSIPGDGHYVKVAPLLTGTPITKTTGSDLRCGAVSLDQLVAQQHGNLTPLPSLELSIEPVTTGVDSNVGYTRLYGSHISWSTPTTPVTREVNPQLAFDRLFRNQGGAGSATMNDRSILDAVQDDAKRLSGQVGKADQLKLEEYLESVRSVERRIQFDATRRKQEYEADPIARAEVEKLGGRIADYYRDPGRLSERGIDHTEQVRLMLDIMVLAFWTDSTRVSTFMFGNEVSGKNFSFLEGVSGGHHQISHHENDAAKMEEYRRINVWHLQQYAYMVERMKSIRDGEGTLLDNSMVMFAGGMRDGNAHSPFNLPIVLAGRGGGTLATGRHLAFEKKTPLCNLYVGMLNRLGTPVERFGDSTAELPGLSDPAYRGVVPAT